MLIRFLRDYRGAHTGEVFYVAGQQADFDQEHAQPIIDEGAAEIVRVETRRGQVDPAAPKGKKG